MRLAIASDDGKTLSMHFGRARGFAIVEIDGKDVKSINYIPNTFTGRARVEHSEHGYHGSHVHIV
ncbi:MAG: NifB/NifX family molybdenum-iron cluster-binding protein [candidate division WOR-3 bacterium]